MKHLTVGQLIEFLQQYDNNLPVVLNHTIMGWVSGVEGSEDSLYRKPNDPSNKFYMLFEDDEKLRDEVSVLKIEAYYKKGDRDKTKHEPGEIASELAKYWVEVDPQTKNPTGNICWAYYPSDRPSVGYWLEVIQTGVVCSNSDVINKKVVRMTEEEFKNTVVELTKGMDDGDIAYKLEIPVTLPARWRSGVSCPLLPIRERIIEKIKKIKADCEKK